MNTGVILFWFCGLFYNGDFTGATATFPTFDAAKSAFRGAVDEARRESGLAGIAEMRCMGYAE
jgi:hypothetical protein